MDNFGGTPDEKGKDEHPFDFYGFSIAHPWDKEV